MKNKLTVTIDDIVYTDGDLVKYYYRGSTFIGHIIADDHRLCGTDIAILYNKNDREYLDNWGVEILEIDSYDNDNNDYFSPIIIENIKSDEIENKYPEYFV